jgi:hypothetical protein
MGPNRKGRLLTVLLAAAALAPAGCKRDRGAGEQPVVGEKVPEVDPSQVRPQAADPHGGPMNPHGAMNMQGGGGSMLEKTAEGKAQLGPVTMAVPKGWQERATQGSMRAAEYAIPGDGGEAHGVTPHDPASGSGGDRSGGEAELIVYYFGAGGAGGVEANLDRWHGQFQGDGGGRATPKTEKKLVAGMPVTLTEVTGHYVAAVMPGAPESHDKPDHALLGAIVETGQGPYYFKLVGPAKTVAAIRADFHGLIDSIQPR